MAFTDSNALFGTTSKTANQTDRTIQPLTLTIAAGSLVVISVAVDNNATTDGDEGAVTGVSDTKSNTWTKAIEFTNGQGGAQAGATISVWYSVLTTALLTTDTITATFSNTTSRDASDINGRGFTLGGNTDIAIASTVTSAVDGGLVDSLTISGLENREYLWWRAGAVEGPEFPTATATSGFTGVEFNATTGGAAVSNMGMFIEFKIATGTTLTSAPTSSTNRDWASAYIAFYQVPPVDLTHNSEFEVPASKRARFRKHSFQGSQQGPTPDDVIQPMSAALVVDLVPPGVNRHTYDGSTATPLPPDNTESFARVVVEVPPGREWRKTQHFQQGPLADDNDVAAALTQTAVPWGRDHHEILHWQQSPLSDDLSQSASQTVFDLPQWRSHHETQFWLQSPLSEESEGATSRTVLGVPPGRPRFEPLSWTQAPLSEAEEPPFVARTWLPPAGPSKDYQFWAQGPLAEVEEQPPVSQTVLPPDGARRDYQFWIQGPIVEAPTVEAIMGALEVPAVLWARPQPELGGWQASPLSEDGVAAPASTIWKPTFRSRRR